MTHLLAIMTFMSAWMNMINPELLLYRTILAVCLYLPLVYTNTPPSSIKHNIGIQVFCSHSADECKIRKLCLQYHLIDL